MTPDAKPAWKPRFIGRPLGCATPEIFLARAELYFRECERSGEPLTITGLAIATHVTDRMGLREYEARLGFSSVVKAAREAVTHAYELRLREDRPTGAIFALKNMGWSDRFDVQLSGTIGRLDLNRLSDEQIARIAAGEDARSVLASAPGVAQLGAGPSEPVVGEVRQGEPPAGEAADVVT